jgi:hypothetical protein
MGFKYNILNGLKGFKWVSNIIYYIIKFKYNIIYYIKYNILYYKIDLKIEFFFIYKISIRKDVHI